MAILGLHGEEARHKEGHECPRVIASEILLPSKDREQQGDAEYEVFLQKWKESMPDGSMSVFSNMINLLFLPDSTSEQTRKNQSRAIRTLGGGESRSNQNLGRWRGSAPV
ncbi:hypothetical protein E4U46_000509 [Claviceps purpurea]|nr:hypothetical protein E4U46_000509 [Claviceps purpurea]